jgi:NAD+ diphosphatase
MSYPETVNLPFNRAVLQDRFRWVYPDMAPPAGNPLWLVLRGDALVVAADPARGRLLEEAQVRTLSPAMEPLCFATWDGRPLLAVRVSRECPLPPDLTAEPFNAFADRLDDQVLTLGGLAQQVLRWQHDACHCSRCTALTRPMPGGWGRECPDCRSVRFPAVHPCAIVLVRRQDEFLLVRKKEWPAGRYSLVAGFLDLGESLEECAAREVAEETGITVTNIRYVGSQHWPFPSQLMAGFVAEYAAGEVRVEEAELEDARWFHRDRLPAALPGKRSIARWIFDRFVAAENPPT